MILEMKGIEEMKNTPLALSEYDSIPQWEISTESAWGNTMDRACCRRLEDRRQRVAVDASSKDQIRGSDYQMVYDSDMGCEEMYSEEVKSVTPGVPGRKASRLMAVQVHKPEQRR